MSWNTTILVSVIVGFLSAVAYGKIKKRKSEPLSPEEMQEIRALADKEDQRGEMKVTEDVVVFIKQKEMGRLILDNLFSEETEKFYNCHDFSTNRVAFMQGMNYAALLCSAELAQYPVIIREVEKHEAESRDGE